MLTLLDAVALSTWPKIRSSRIPQFLQSLAPEAVPGDPLVASLEWAKTGGADALAATLRANAEEVLAQAARAGITAIPWGDPRYPPLLATIFDPPVVLWVKGRAEVLRNASAALVGSRGPSPYGLEAATRLASELAALRVTIVSGLARGIDSAAHRGALQAGGVTVAVLGCGADVVYPREHAELAESIARAGAIVSELPPGTPPRAMHFPARNRIISGLSLVVVVVEAAEQSGSLITAEFAEEQGRDVLAVPGSIFSGRQAGCHALIRDGAGIAGGASDVMWAISTSPLRRLAGEGGTEPIPPNPLLEAMQPGEACDVDSLARRSGLSPALLLSRMLELELQGAVRRAEGSRFVRVSRTC